MIKIYQLRRYLWSLFGILGVVAFWAGVWDGVGNLSYLSNPLISLIVGLIILISTGLLFKQSDPLAEEANIINKTIHEIHNHPQKQEFSLHYHDQAKQKQMMVGADQITNIEKSFIILNPNRDQEVFIPMHRVKKITRQGKVHWEA